MRPNNLLAIAVFIAAIVNGPAFAQTPSYQDHMTKAGAAFDAEDWTSLNTHLDDAQAIRPYSLYVWKNRILARQLDGRTEDALDLAETIARRGLSMNLTGHEALEALTANPVFAPIADKMTANLAPIGDDGTHTLYDDPNLLPEAYAATRRGAAYIGSVRTGKIIDLSNASHATGVAMAPGGVFDIELRGKKLWAAVNNQLAFENAGAEDPFAAIIIYDLKTGEAQQDVRANAPDALFGDLEVAKDRTAYASDSLTPRIFKMAPGGDTLEVFAEDPRFVNLQGIALDQKHKRLFIADYLAGLFVVELETGAVTAIENTIDAHLGGIDGLYVHRGDLIGVQNGTTPQRIIRIALNKDADEAIDLEILAQNLDGWNEPTHGAVIGKQFNYIATSNWPSYDNDWNLRDGAEPQPMRIMTVPLD